MGWADPVGQAALEVQHARAGLAILFALAGVHRLVGFGIVEVRHQVQPVLLEGQRAVGIEKVGLIAVHQILDAVEPVALPAIGNVGVPGKVLSGNSSAGRDTGRNWRVRAVVGTPAYWPVLSES
jgi:hypothetical protein